MSLYFCYVQTLEMSLEKRGKDRMWKDVKADILFRTHPRHEGDGGSRTQIITKRRSTSYFGSRNLIPLTRDSPCANLC